MPKTWFREQINLIKRLASASKNYTQNASVMELFEGA